MNTVTFVRPGGVEAPDCVCKSVSSFSAAGVFLREDSKGQRQTFFQSRAVVGNVFGPPKRAPRKSLSFVCISHFLCCLWFLCVHVFAAPITDRTDNGKHFRTLWILRGGRRIGYDLWCMRLPVHPSSKSASRFMLPVTLPLHKMFRPASECAALHGALTGCPHRAEPIRIRHPAASAIHMRCIARAPAMFPNFLRRSRLQSRPQIIAKVSPTQLDVGLRFGRAFLCSLQHRMI